MRGSRDAALRLGGDSGTRKQTLLPRGGCAGALQRFWVAAVSEELFRGKTTRTFLSTMEPSARRCCGPGASSEDEDVQEYLKEENYS